MIELRFTTVPTSSFRQTADETSALATFEQVKSYLKTELPSKSGTNWRFTREGGEQNPFAASVGPGMVFNALTIAPTAGGLADANKTDVKMPYFLVSNAASHIVELPRVKVVTNFEPHFRQSTVKGMIDLVGRFQDSLGQPEAAATAAELRAFLTSAYTKSISDPETRTMGTAISLLQDFLRPHWSQISSPKLEGVKDRLVWLSSHEKLAPRIVEKFYTDLSSVIGNRISIPLENDPELLEDLE